MEGGYILCQEQEKTFISEKMVDGKVVIAEHNVIALGKYLSHTLAVRLVYRYLQKWASRG